VTRAPVIVDTNVVVAGLLTSDKASPVARVLDGMLIAALPFVLSEALLAEYRAVLVRPELRKLHGLAIAEVEVILMELAQHAIVLDAAPGAPAPDAGDQLLWDLLNARSDLVLVTGHKLLLQNAQMSGRVLSPRDFLAGT
jgi:predicted nucleic acid-binding protein